MVPLPEPLRSQFNPDTTNTGGDDMTRLFKYVSPVRKGALASVSVLAWAVAVPGSSAAQSTVTVGITNAAVNLGGPAECHVTVQRSANADSKDADVLDVEIFDDAAMTKPAQLETPVSVVIDGQVKGQVDKGSSGRKISLGTHGLNDAIVRIRRTDADHLEDVGKDLCQVNAVPLVVVGVPATLTEFVADGDVSSALRSGTDQTGATGSLGIHHRNVKSRRSHFLWFIPVDVEEFRGLITVASASDALADSSAGGFAQAILAPETATRGNIGSVYLEYSPMEQYGNGSQFRGLWASARVVRSLWRSMPHALPGGTPYTDSISKNVTISTLDLRYRWTPIARVSDERGNVFQVSLDVGYTFRELDGDGGLDSTFLRATMGSGRRVFQGPIGGVGISLRQVRAIAELPFFPRSKTESLEGLQPVFRFSFEAPMIRF